MKISVLVGREGEILATKPHEAKRRSGVPEITFVAGRGQKVHVLDVRIGSRTLSSPEALHDALRRRIGDSASAGRKKVRRKPRQA